MHYDEVKIHFARLEMLYQTTHVEFNNHFLELQYLISQNSIFFLQNTEVYVVNSCLSILEEKDGISTN